MSIEIPNLDEIGWGYPKELLGTRSKTSITIRPLTTREQHVKIDFRRQHTDVHEEIAYEIAMRREMASKQYTMPEEMEALIRHFQGWVEANSAAMRVSKGFWMEYLGSYYPTQQKSPNSKIYTAVVRVRFRWATGFSE